MRACGPQLLHYSGDLGDARDVFAEEDHSTDQAETDLLQQAFGRRETRVGEDHPLA